MFCTLSGRTDIKLGERLFSVVLSLLPFSFLFVICLMGLIYFSVKECSYMHSFSVCMAMHCWALHALGVHYCLRGTLLP